MMSGRVVEGSLQASRESITDRSASLQSSSPWAYPNGTNAELVARDAWCSSQIYGATLPPFVGSRFSSAAAEAKRQAVNHWIRTSRAYDAVIDSRR
jgi:hypothetical protein